MEKCNKKDDHLTKPASSYHNNDPTKSYKPIKRQYFTFGKDNCLVHHPTTQSKKSSPSAIFCKTNTFSTQSQANKTCHKKLKSTLRAPKKQEKFTSHADAIKHDAISKITRNLKHPHTSSVSDSNSLSIIVRGTSIKLEPKKHFEISTCCASGYCPSIKRCKMCGEVMLNIQSSITKDYSSSASCSGCLEKQTNSIDCKEKVENNLHQHNPVIKRCIICSKLFKLPSSSVVCEKCPTFIRTQGHERGPVPVTKEAFLKTNSEKIGKNLMSSRLRDNYIDTFTKCKASQCTKYNKLPSKSKDTMEDLLQVRSLSSKQQHKTKINVPGNSVSTENSTKAMETKLSTETNQLNTRTKNTAEKTIPKGYIYSEQCKNTNDGRGKVSKMPPSTKSFKSNLAKKFYSLPEEPTPEIDLDPELYKHNDITSNISSAQKSNMPVQSRSLPEKNQLTTSKNINLATKCKSLPEEPTPEIFADAERYKCTNGANKKSSVEKSNTPIQTKPLPERSQLTTSKNDADEPPLKNYLASKQCKNTNLDYEAAVADKSSMFIQTNSLSTTNLDTTISGISSESFSSEDYLIREQTEDSNIDQRKASSEESNTPACHQKSKSNPENYFKKQNKNVNQTTKEDSAETPIHTKSFQLDQDFLSKISAGLVLHHSKDENISPSPVIQNVTVNNYYYLKGCDVKKILPNSPMTCTNHPSSTAKHSSSGSTSVSSELEDSVEIDKIQDKQNKSHFYNKARSGHLKNSSFQIEFPKSVSEEMSGVFKHNTDNFLSNVFGSQHDKISFLNDAGSALENYPGPAIGEICNLSSNLYHIGRQEMSFQNYNHDAQALYGVKTVNPYIQKSLMIFEEMDNIRNEPIDPEKILEKLKQNPQLMKAIDQMAAKKLNFPRKATVFKDL